MIKKTLQFLGKFVELQANWLSGWFACFFFGRCLSGRASAPNLFGQKMTKKDFRSNP